MAIAPYILIPSATLAVLLMILFIRLMTGRRNAHLEEATVRDFLSHEEAGISISGLSIDETGTAALIKLEDEHPLRLIRSFGDRMVMQILEFSDLQIEEHSDDGALYIKRQDISHPGFRFKGDVSLLHSMQPNEPGEHSYVPS
ncbi:MAG: hypothetical protein ABJN40_10410 [Sneathiella sp.]